jgi:hypothetical protein
MSECSKICYLTRAAATIAMRPIARQYAARGLKSPTGAYFCSACKGWHLTSKSATQVAPWERARGRG